MVESAINLRQPWELSTLFGNRQRSGNEMAESPGRASIPAMGLEAIGLTDRTDPMPNPDLMAIHPGANQNPGREARQIKLKVAASTRCERLPESL